MRILPVGLTLLVLVCRVAGADHPRVEPSTDRFSPRDRDWWSLQPVVEPPLPAVQDAGWVRNPIDLFVLESLEAAGLRPSPQADPNTLLRRIYQTTLGLPPGPAAVREFAADPSDENLRRKIDDLLSSPAYGEHWAAYWLDLVRYADSDGYKADSFRPHAWRYRDYVIAALNADKPYDRFIQEQLAGDELAPHDPEAIVATGFLRHGIYEYNQRDVATQWQDMLNDITDTTADAVLGLGMSCARCHDHKFDPILQRDYYRLQAFFAGLALRDARPLASPDEVAVHSEKLAAWEDATADLRRQIAALEAPPLAELAQAAITQFAPELEAIFAKPAAERTPHEQQIAHLIQLQVIDRQAMLETRIKGDDRQRWKSLKEELARFDPLKPRPLPAARSAADIAAKPPPTRNPGDGGRHLDPGYLTILEPGPAAIAAAPEAPDSSGRRSALARWMTRDDHPLTARVIVNRVWQHHFGKGIVATPSDFGTLGDRPSHPALLDWLAANFVRQGWSLKWLHRTILTSATYRQASAASDPERAARVDPANRLLARQAIRRLRGEQIRDAMLAASGELQRHRQGPPVDLDESSRRSIYGKVLRNSRHELLDVFDFPDRITGAEQRSVTTTSAQSLWMINGSWTHDRAQAMARRLVADCGSDPVRIVRRGYLLAFSRLPTSSELATSAAFLSLHDERPRDSAGGETVRLASRSGERLSAAPPGVGSPSPDALRMEPSPRLVDFCHVLLNANEFIYVD